MRNASKIPILRESDGELLGFIIEHRTSWSAQTVFGYVFARVESRSDAENVVRSQGSLILKGMWRYQDADGQWYPCIISQAYENRVTVVRTNELGFQDSKLYKMVTIKNPTDSELVQA